MPLNLSMIFRFVESPFVTFWWLRRTKQQKLHCAASVFFILSRRDFNQSNWCKNNANPHLHIMMVMGSTKRMVISQVSSRVWINRIGKVAVVEAANWVESSAKRPFWNILDGVNHKMCDRSVNFRDFSLLFFQAGRLYVNYGDVFTLKSRRLSYHHHIGSRALPTVHLKKLLTFYTKMVTGMSFLNLPHSFFVQDNLLSVGKYLESTSLSRNSCWTVELGIAFFCSFPFFETIEVFHKIGEISVNFEAFSLLLLSEHHLVSN